MNEVERVEAAAEVAEILDRQVECSAVAHGTFVVVRVAGRDVVLQVMSVGPRTS